MTSKTIVVLLFVTLNLQAQAQMEQSLVYTYPKSASIMARVAKLVIRLRGSKRSVVKCFETNQFNAEPAPIPAKFFTQFQIDTAQTSGRNVYTIAPKESSSGKHILYIHGGAYINNLIAEHWKLIGELVRRTNHPVIVPDYPLAPTATVVEALPMVETVYKALLQKTSPDRIVFMGDSAGAGLALALAQKLKADGGPLPQQLILLSPWLDVTMSNPAIKAVEKNDPMLGVEGLQLAGKAYAGTLATTDYRVSPINGSLEGLPTISVFIGGDDVLIADARKFKLMMDQKGMAIKFFDYPSMFHVWVAATFLKEAKQAINQITQLVL